MRTGALLAAGANTGLPDGPWSLTASGPVDLSAVVLSADGKVRSDLDLVFWNQPAAPGVRLAAGAVVLDPDRLRAGAERVVVLASSEDTVTPLGRVAAPALLVRAGHTEVARFVAAGLTSETVVQLAEVYRREGRWKLRALGAGYADGLAGLVRDFGVRVDNAPVGGGGPLGEVVALTNRRRAEHGLGPLAWADRLAAAAQAHNDDMVRRGFFAHESPDGRSVADRVRSAGYDHRVVAENIAAGQRTTAEVVRGWMDSPVHRANSPHADVREIASAPTVGGAYGRCGPRCSARRCAERSAGEHRTYRGRSGRAAAGRARDPPAPREKGTS